MCKELEEDTVRDKALRDHQLVSPVGQKCPLLPFHPTPQKV